MNALKCVPFVRDAGVAGSNPAAPTIFSRFRSGSSSDQGGSRTMIASAPTKQKNKKRQVRLDDVCIVGDAQLIGDREQERIGLGDGLILLELLDQNVRLGCVAAAKDCARAGVDEADLVFTLALVTEIGAVAFVDQREDAAADRDSRFTHVTGFFPRGAVGPDLSGLLHMESLAGLVILERRALQVHAELGRPHRRVVRSGTPPDTFAQALRIRLEPQQTGRVRKHRSWIWLGKTF